MSEFRFEGRVVQAEDGETVLEALLRSDIDVAHGCKAGACQSCVLRTPSPPTSAQAGLDETLVEAGAFLSCLAKAGDVSEVDRLDPDAVPRYPATVRASRRLSSDVLLIQLEAEGFSASPGRFVRLVHPSGVLRPYSLATPAWDSSSSIHLHVRLIPNGRMSFLLERIRVGQALEVVGPFGKCRYRSETRSEPILMVGSGTGLAPLYGIATDALHQGHLGPIELHHGAATGDRLYFRQELADLERRFPNFRYRPYADSAPHNTDAIGSPLDGALALHPKLDGFKVYTCGHPDLVRMAKRKCFLAGANLKDIAADAFEDAGKS